MKNIILSICFISILTICVKTQAGVISSDRYFYFNTNLSYGMKDNAEVRLLQKYLIENKYLKGVPNGSFYGPTLTAVKKLQKKIGLQGTGLVGSKTRDFLNREFAEAEGVSADNVKYVNGICGLDISTPYFSEIEFPLTIEVGQIKNNNKYCNWTEFEGSLGSISLYYGEWVDGKGNTISKASGESFSLQKGKITFTGKGVINKKGYIHLVFEEENPSGFKSPKKFILRLDNYK